jgi:hypothetical protein
MTVTNKCLAQSNKSRTRGRATKKREVGNQLERAEMTTRKAPHGEADKIADEPNHIVPKHAWGTERSDVPMASI